MQRFEPNLPRINTNNGSKHVEISATKSLIHKLQFLITDRFLIITDMLAEKKLLKSKKKNIEK